jgi:cyclopropane fatty-acyl-phospholipid synthase-like methyltransferase
MPKKPEWWQDVFGSFRPVFDSISVRQSNSQARYLIEKLRLKPGQRFLDCPCGIGRIALPLAKRGIKVTGVDITPSYLDELSAVARRRSLKLDLLCDDMRRIKFRNRFDAAANLQTSIGYFAKDADDKLILRRMFDALKPGGRFMLQTVNRDWILAHWQGNDWAEFGDMTLLQRRRFDHRTSKMHALWRFINHGEARSYDITLRLYSYHELARMLEAVGFVNVEGFGSMKDEPINRDTRDMWVVSVKPKR